MEQSRGKRGQVTLFIILGIIIIAGILAYFLTVKPTTTTETNKGPLLDSCVQDAVEQAITDLSKTAGSINPEFTYPYQGEQYVYLCYTNQYYETCTVQQPLLKQHFETSLERYVRENIDSCYENAIDELQSQGYGVQRGTITYDINLEPGIVAIKLNAPTSIGTQEFKQINIQFQHPIYNNIMIATSIIQNEASYGDTNINTLMILNADYTIDKLKQSEGTTLYKIENKQFKSTFNFASRSLAWPPGYAGRI